MTVVVPHGVVRARRATGAILLSSSIVSVIAVVLALGLWVTAPPQVHPIDPNGTTGLGPSPSASPTPVTPTGTPEQQLAGYRAGDATDVASIPDGYWVPQLASNRPGTDAKGRYWDDAAILQDHVSWRAYGGVLLWSGDFATFTSTDYWVTVVPSMASSTSGQVISWCKQQGIGRDNCFAKRLSTSNPYTHDNTVHQT